MKNLLRLVSTICLFIVFMLCVGGCKTLIKTVDHPINFWYVSIMALILAVLLLFAWFVGWKKTQKREADST